MRVPFVATLTDLTPDLRYNWQSQGNFSASSSSSSFLNLFYLNFFLKKPSYRCRSVEFFCNFSQSSGLFIILFPFQKFSNTGKNNFRFCKKVHLPALILLLRGQLRYFLVLCVFRQERTVQGARKKGFQGLSHVLLQ